MATIAALAALAGCGSSQGAATAATRDLPYFARHIDEARRVRADCIAHNVRTDECRAAGSAIFRSGGFTHPKPGTYEWTPPGVQKTAPAPAPNHP